MKYTITALIVFLLLGNMVYAADGDLIVNGNLGVGTVDPIAPLDVTTAGGAKKIIKEITTGQPDYSYYYLKLFTVPTGTSNNTIALNGRVTVYRSNDLGVSATSEIYVSRGYNSQIYFSQINQKGLYGSFQLVQVTDGGQNWAALLYDTHTGAGIFSWHVDLMVKNNVNPTSLSLTGLTSTSPLHTILANINYGNTIIPNGNIGIGTTSPQNKLHVRSASGMVTRLDAGERYGTGLLFFNDYNDVTGNFRINVGGDPTIVPERKNKMIFFSVGDTGGSVSRDILTLSNDGKIGIGTTSPHNAVDVVGQIGTTWGTTFNTYFWNGAWTNTGAGYAGALQFAPQTGIYYFWTSSASAAAGAANPMVSATMTLHPNGRVGIMSGDPNATLQVKGSVSLGSGSAYADRALCWTSAGTIGYCSSEIDVRGGCTCNAIN